MALGAVQTPVESLPKQQSSGYREYYSNNAQIRFTPFDVTILFTLIKEDVSSGGVVNESQVSVVLSPIQFKLLAQTCGGIVGMFEQTFGEIKLPVGIGPAAASPVITEQLRAAIEKDGGSIIAKGAGSIALASSTEQKRPGKRSHAAGKKKAT